jgi:hypothetical protein
MQWLQSTDEKVWYTTIVSISNSKPDPMFISSLHFLMCRSFAMAITSLSFIKEERKWCQTAHQATLRMSSRQSRSQSTCWDNFLYILFVFFQRLCVLTIEENFFCICFGRYLDEVVKRVGAKVVEQEAVGLKTTLQNAIKALLAKASKSPSKHLYIKQTLRQYMYISMTLEFIS